MDLDARAVHLVFERGFAKIGQGFGDVFGRFRQHGLNGPEQLHIVLREAGLALFKQRPRDESDIAGQHDGAADATRRRSPDALADASTMTASERSLAKFAREQSDQELLLGFGGAGEHLLEQLEALSLGAAAAGGRDGFEDAVDLGEFQSRGRGLRASGVPDRGITHADASLANHA